MNISIMTLSQAIFGSVENTTNTVGREEALRDDISIMNFGAFIVANGASTIFSFIQSEVGNGYRQSQFNRRFSGLVQFALCRQEVFGFYEHAKDGNLVIWGVKSDVYEAALEEYQEWCVANPRYIRSALEWKTVDLWVMEKFKKSGKACAEVAPTETNATLDWMF